MERIRVMIILPLALFAVALGACAADDQPDLSAEPEIQAEPSEQMEAPPAQYKLQAEDVLRVSVWGEPNITGEHMVDPQGNINMPLLGQLHIEGLTHKELIDKIKGGLSKYLVDPKVQVTLVRFSKPKVHVLGQVHRPGVHEVKLGDKVMEAIARAGSFTEAAHLEEATLSRKDSEEPIPLDLRKLFYEGDMSKNLELQDGDTIYIPEDTTNKYYVLGQILRPGLYRLKENVTVMDAISNAGGPTPRGILKGTVVIRGDLKDSQRIKVDIGKLIKKADLKQNIELEPGDVVYVPETSRPDWGKISGVVSAVVNSAYLFRMIGL